MTDRGERSRVALAEPELKTGTPKQGVDCQFCEDWGTIVFVDERGYPVGTEFCVCERGRAAQDRTP